MYLFILLLFVTIAGIRYRVGGDTLGYYDKFDNIPYLSELPSFNFQDAQYNFSWYLFSSIAKSINNSFYSFQILHSVVVNCIIFWFFGRFAINKFFILPFYFFLYYFYFNMEILREALAICVFLISIPYLLERKFIKYYFMVFIAFTFHSSALVLVFIPIFLSKYKLKTQIITIITVGVIFSTLINNSFLMAIGLDKIFGASAMFYLDKNVNINGVIYQLLKLLPFFSVFVISSRNKYNPDDRKLYEFDYFIYPYLLIGVIAAFIPGIYRFQNYLIIPVLVYIVNQFYYFLLNKKRFSKSYLQVSVFISIIVMFQFYYFLRDESEISKVPGTKMYDLFYPYFSIFDERLHAEREMFHYNLIQPSY